MLFPKKLSDKLQSRALQNALRKLPLPDSLIDFASNDYLGFARSEKLFSETHDFLLSQNIQSNGSTGSRLISGNDELYEETEKQIADFHNAESALIFNSGYDANVGFFSSVPQKDDVILYDELCHASIRDGIRLSNAKAYKFSHNDTEDLENLLRKFSESISGNQIYIATESVFSMDGDSPDPERFSEISEKYNALLVIDEAHALGVFGENGNGLIQEYKLENKTFARIVTFGKGLGCHGAAILGSSELRNYLINFARSFIYTTGIPPHSVATIHTAYLHLQNNDSQMKKLRENIVYFNQQKVLLGLKPLFVRSKSAIQSAVIPGNNKVKSIAESLQQNGFNVKAILSPTVPEGQERLRICLHSYNSEAEISKVLELLGNFVL